MYFHHITAAAISCRMMMRLVSRQRHAVLELDLPVLEVIGQDVPPLVVAHATDPSGGDVELLAAAAIIIFAVVAAAATPRRRFHHVVVHQRLDELPDLLQTQVDLADVGLLHLVHDGPQADAPAAVEPLDAVQDEVAQFGDELVIELQFGVPRSPRQLLGRLQIVQHVQLLGLGRDGLGRLDQPPALQTLEDLVERELLDVGLRPDVLGPDAHVAGLLDDLVHEAGRRVEALELAGLVLADEAVHQFVGRGVLRHGEASSGGEGVDDGGELGEAGVAEPDLEGRVGHPAAGRGGLGSAEHGDEFRLEVLVVVVVASSAGGGSSPGGRGGIRRRIWVGLDPCCRCPRGGASTATSTCTGPDGRRSGALGAGGRSPRGRGRRAPWGHGGYVSTSLAAYMYAQMVLTAYAGLG